MGCNAKLDGLSCWSGSDNNWAKTRGVAQVHSEIDQDIDEREDDQGDDGFDDGDADVGGGKALADNEKKQKEPNFEESVNQKL